MAGRTSRALAMATVLTCIIGIGQAGATGDISSEIERLQADLLAVTAERDALIEQAEARTERYQASSVAQQQIIDIIAEPWAFGSEAEALDRLAELAVPSATMDDVALGIADWRTAWRGTLFGAQADIRTWAKWMAGDGSIGGSLWTWSGNAGNGEPFALPGIDISTYDEDGRTISVVVHWPYEDDVVACHVQRGSEACSDTDR